MQMEDDVLFRVSVTAGIPLAALMWWWTSSSRYHVAPYGRHYTSAIQTLSLPGTHVMLPARLGWCLMESPPLLLMAGLFSKGKYSSQIAPRAVMGLFLVHYAHRCLLYPLWIRPSHKQNFPLIVFLCGFLFNVYNAYIQVRSISHFTRYPSNWLSSPQFFSGAILFFFGMTINILADVTLISLRKSGSSTTNSSNAYKIPSGGLFEWVSCPNYFGEIVEWLGWAIATSSLPGLVFFLLVLANLLPRALAHHHWYLEHFHEYPRLRKAVIPFLF